MFSIHLSHRVLKQPLSKAFLKGVRPVLAETATSFVVVAARFCYILVALEESGFKTLLATVLLYFCTVILRSN